MSQLIAFSSMCGASFHTPVKALGKLGNHVIQMRVIISFHLLSMLNMRNKGEN